jgi:quercetin dioxygenase-like cupin family protein
LSGLVSVVALAQESRQANSAVEVAVLAKSTKSWDGEALPAYPAGQPEVSILRYTIPPRTRLALHKHEVINAGILLKGNLTVVAEDDRVLELKAGETIIELVGKWHYGVNRTDEPAEILVFYAGTEGKLNTIKAGETPNPDPKGEGDDARPQAR